jgi:hypothetical protein
VVKRESLSCSLAVAVGMPVTRHPRYKAARAHFTHAGFQLGYVASKRSRGEGLTT